jgi:hypothetical protein
MNPKALSFFNFLQKVKGIDIPFKVKLNSGEVKEGDSFGSVKLRDNVNYILPDNLTFENLVIQFSPIEKLPNNLKVERDLHLGHLENLQELPNSISANDLFISGSQIKTIPSFLKHGVKNIVCYKMTELTEIKWNWVDFLNIDKCESLTKLVDNLNIKFALKVYNTPIEHIGKNTKVYYETLFHDTNISEFPDDFRPGKFLSLKNSPVMKKYTKEQLENRFPGTTIYYD